jgi:hypothetical protein
VSEPNGSGPNWSTIFDSAHRRVAGRILLLAGIAAAAALLLLSGGLTANGTITLDVLPTKNEPKKKPAKKAKQEKKHHNQDQPPSHRNVPPDQRHKNARPDDPKKHSNDGGKGKPKCKGENGDSADKQYEDCPPNSGEDEADKAKAEAEAVSTAG